MKKILFLFALVTLSACQKNEPDLLLGKNASQRIAEANEQLKNTLSQAPNGWKMSYFPKKNSYLIFSIKYNPVSEVNLPEFKSVIFLLYVIYILVLGQN